MKFVGRIERLVKNLRVATDAETEQRILGDALAVINAGGQTSGGWNRLPFGQIRSWRMFKVAIFTALGTIAVFATQYLVFLLQMRFEYTYAMGY